MTLDAGSGIREEYFENVPSGLEVEEEADAPSGVRPWDPSAIRVTTKRFSLRNILDLIDEASLELAPDFQRNQVWKPKQKSRLIESVLLQIPLPAFYFAEDADGGMRVVDGLQRLSTVHSYVRSGSFALQGLEYLTKEQGKPFVELAPVLQRRIYNTQIVVHVIDPTTPSDVTYDIFKRINTGGTPLSAQEIRHCMSNNRSRGFLKKCTESDEFQRATAGSLKNHIRMGDREAALRFCAFWLGGVDGYRSFGAMDPFLEHATKRLDDPSGVSDETLDQVYEAFLLGMRNSYEVFRDHAFRKWPLGAKSRNPINRPLFETWSYVLSRHNPEDIARRAAAIADAARRMMTTEQDYIDAITTSTGDPNKVALRFERAERAAKAQ